MPHCECFLDENIPSVLDTFAYFIHYAFPTVN
jgi:hypothetical protein